MGWRYRKSVKAGPFRLNFSKSGIGYSVGSKHYRVTKTAKGTVRRTVTLPGGISHVEEYKAENKPAAQKRPAVGRGKIIWGVIIILAGIYSAPKDPALAWKTCLVGVALLAWAVWDRHKLKKSTAPVAEKSKDK